MRMVHQVYTLGCFHLINYKDQTENVFSFWKRLEISCSLVTVNDNILHYIAMIDRDYENTSNKNIQMTFMRFSLKQIKSLFWERYLYYSSLSVIYYAICEEIPKTFCPQQSVSLFVIDTICYKQKYVSLSLKHSIMIPQRRKSVDTKNCKSNVVYMGV